MILRSQSLVLGTLLGALCLPAAQAADANADAVRLGKIRFRNDCAACHGMDGKGNGPAATSLRQAPSDLTGLAARNDGQFPEDYVRKVIDGREFQALAHGSVDMPVWGSQYRRSLAGLSEKRVQERIAALVAYLRTIQVP